MLTLSFILKIPFILLVIILTSFSIYSLAVVKHYKSLTVLPKVPEPFRTLNKKFMAVPILAHTISYYEAILTLIYNSASYAKLYATAFSVIIPSISIITVILAFFLVNRWYFSILIATYGIIIPYLFVTNLVRDKNRNFRIACLKLYEGAERGFSSQLPVATVFEEISRSSTGIVRRIALGFLEEHSTSNENGYIYLVDTIGDKYAVDFAKIVKFYEDTGADPCQAIKRTVKFAKRQYQLDKIAVNANKALKTLATVLLFISIGCAFCSILIAESLDVSTDTSYLTYFAIVGILTVYTMTLLNDRVRG